MDDTHGVGLGNCWATVHWIEPHTTARERLSLTTHHWPWIADPDGASSRMPGAVPGRPTYYGKLYLLNSITNLKVMQPTLRA